MERLLPRRARTGRPATDARTVLEGVLWVLATGAPWRDLPVRFGPWQTVYGRFRAWIASGALDRVFARLRRDLVASRAVDLGLWCVDTTIVRASRASGGAREHTRGGHEPRDHALGRSRGGFGTKIALVCDGRGTPLAATVRPGQQHDSRSFEAVLRSALRTADRPRRLAADKAYSVAWIRTWLRRRGIEPVVPTRCDQRADPAFAREDYRQRNVIERLVGWLKESRRVATRYEKLATTYLAFVTLAMIRRLLRALAEFSNTT